MTEVTAGTGQPAAQPGQRGLATVWVQSDSEDDALRRAREIVESHRYASFGELTIFQEEATHTPATPAVSDTAGDGDRLASGYTSMRENALARGDGLFEIWFPESQK